MIQYKIWQHKFNSKINNGERNLSAAKSFKKSQ